MTPLRNSEPNTQEAIWASDSPPRVPVARMIARGPLAANRKATRPLTAWVAARSRQKLGAGAVGTGAVASAGMWLGGWRTGRAGGRVRLPALGFGKGWPPAFGRILVVLPEVSRPVSGTAC